MKGSGYKAREFIDGEGRQKFQKEMTDELVKILGEKSILVRNAIVRHVEVPSDILQPIQETSIAKEQDLTNKTQQETAKKQAKLNTELAMVDQRTRETEQETEKLTATIAAEMRKDVAGIAADAQLRVAEINLDTATWREAPLGGVHGAVHARRPAVRGVAWPGLLHPRAAFRGGNALDGHEGCVARAPRPRRGQGKVTKRAKARNFWYTFRR